MEAREGSEPAMITVARDLDLSRTISAVVNASFDEQNYRIPVMFAPNVTEQTVSLPLSNDELYNGIRFYYLALTEATGGTLVQNILNDDARARSAAKSNVLAGTDVELTLDIGSPFEQPETVLLTSSDESVAGVPTSVVVGDPLGADVSRAAAARNRSFFPVRAARRERSAP